MTGDSPARTAPGWLELFVALGAALVLYGVGSALILVFPPSDPVVEGMANFALSGLAPIGAFAAAVLVRIRDVRAFGMRRVAPKWLLVAVGLAAVCLAVVLAFDAIAASFFPDTEDVQSGYRAAANAGILTLLATIALGGLLTPFGEEVLFRAVLTRFLQRWRTWIAILVSAFVFALAHGVNLIFPAAFVVGLCTGWLLCRTGSIWPGVLVHVLYNTSFLVIYSLT